MRTSDFDTARRFYIDTVQNSPLQRPIKGESAIIFSSPSTKTFSFPVEGGRTMELAIAQFWSSGIGSQETIVVGFERKCCLMEVKHLSHLMPKLFFALRSLLRLLF
ncbi:hypothetical protein RHMOL_Rhmol05G0175000 [Rhododendron molle]|uniref:Uncharacterized protein n=1 Tax=Rhododendron molle TaxID=49168 RepID=A0ACC0NRG0_RHOML|nr:hypothetical protein RHMOL_Rhmol05G0175000 [Rhododendron molle]